jgi:nucleoid-associated protein Lsr2
MEAKMAQRVTVELEDDLNGGPADETLRFGLGGSDYEIDLNKKNAKRFRRQIAPYIEHARKAGRGQRRRPARAASSREHSGDIRTWAKDKGIPVSERGRIPVSVVEQYEAATAGA